MLEGLFTTIGSTAQSILKLFMIPVTSVIILTQTLTGQPITQNVSISPKTLEKITIVPSNKTGVTGTVNFNVNSIFDELVLIKKDATDEGTLTAPNIIYQVLPGTGIAVSPGQRPIITNSGITSINNQ